MIKNEIQPVSIIGCGKSLPDRIVTNDDLTKILDTSDEWIQSRTGIKERRVVEGDKKVADFAAEAGLAAIKNAGIDKNDIDMIIVATSIPDNLYPSVACETQSLMGLTEKNIPCFDVAAACTGTIYSLNIARAYIRSGLYKTILVIGADIHSRFVDWTDRSVCVLFGDGAGAFVVQRSKDDVNRILSIEIKADGTKSDELKIPLTGKNCPLVAPNNPLPQIVHMNGREIYKFAINALPSSILSALKAADLTLEDLDYVVPHQANIRILDAAREKLGLSESQLYANMDKYGNTSAASIPIAFTEVMEQNLVKKPCIMAITGFGAGLTWGTAIIKVD